MTRRTPGEGTSGRWRRSPVRDRPRGSPDRARRPGRRDEAGAAVPVVVACVGLLLTVGLATGWVGAVVVAHRETQSAADLAALAGATAVQQGRAGCPRAGDVADRNGVRLVDCTVRGRAVRVTVQQRGPALGGRHPRMRARARAGPVGCAACDGAQHPPR